MTAVFRGKRALGIFCLWLIVASYGRCAQNVVYSEDFEGTNYWRLFEELVGPAYTNGIADLDVSTDYSYSGSQSLCVWANQAGSTNSNHVIGWDQVYTNGQTGVWTYTVHFLINPETGATGQTGPEFGMHSTREISPGQWRTMEAGIQYQSNPHSSPGTWAVWDETSPGAAAWIAFTNQPLQTGVWYKAVLQVDFTDNRYQYLEITGNGLDIVWDLTDRVVAEQVKYFEGAFNISLEGENMWQGAQTNIFEHKVFYDDVSLARPISITNNITNDVTWTLADSPVAIDSFDCTITTNARVTIDPGVTVNVAGTLTVEGEVSSEGRPEAPVVFDEINPGDKWGFLKFGLAGAEYRTNFFSWTEFRNMDSYVYISQQGVHFSNCVFTITNSANYGIYGYVNRGSGNPAELSLVSNVIDVTLTRHNNTADIEGLMTDGFPTVIRDNTITVTSTGEVQSVHAYRHNRSNTTSEESHLTGNRIVLNADLSGRTWQTYGLYYENDVSGLVSNNEITVYASRDVEGIHKYDESPIVGNRITVNSSGTNTFATMYGIREQCPTADTNDIVVNNVVNVRTDEKSRTMYGILCQEGRTRGNMINVYNGSTNGSITALQQQYYEAWIENNTIVVETLSGISSKGINIGTHFNSSVVVQVVNNLVVGSGLARGLGLEKGSGCAAIVSNSFNLVCNFETNYLGLAAGAGAVTNRPMLDGEMRLTRNSAGVDAGLMRDWSTTGRDIDGQPRVDNMKVDIGADEYFYQAVATNTFSSGNTVTSFWSVVTGGFYQVQVATSLVSECWQDLGAPLTSQIPVVTTVYTNNSSGGPQYYRILRSW